MLWFTVYLQNVYAIEMQDYRFQIDWAKHWTLLWIRHRTLHGANFVEVSYAWRFTTFVAWVHDDTYDRWAVERSHVCSQRQAFRWSPTVILDFLNTMYGAVIVSTLELYVPRFTISKVLRNRMNPYFCKSWCTIGFAMHTFDLLHDYSRQFRRRHPCVSTEHRDKNTYRIRASFVFW